MLLIGVRMGFARTFICYVVVLCAVHVLPASAAQTDIHGPPGSVAFGHSVTVLPNGNVVVTDPAFSAASVSHIGAVYLYTHSGALISTLTGSTAEDLVGVFGVHVVGHSNFVVVSRNWSNAGASNAGAVTWVDGTNGLNDTVSPANSLVGTQQDDGVGSGGITLLANGNYVVSSTSWHSGTLAEAGAATWGQGDSGVTGAVSASNSLVGSTRSDGVGSKVTALSNGNYVVASPAWNNGVDNGVSGTGLFGAVTWADGTTGIAGAVTSANSLIGTTLDDSVGICGVTALPNGNYVVGSCNWHEGSGGFVGAVTWGDGAHSMHGTISTSNSLLGSTPGDYVGVGGIVTLHDGNYVVVSPDFNSGVANAAVGAVTWANGAAPVTGRVGAGNSLLGSTAHDHVGSSGIVALGNGNYVVASPNWNGGTADAQFGAVTWLSGGGTSAMPVLSANSIVGSTTGDRVGRCGVVALSNGNYVFASPHWNNVVPNSGVGAVTWADGTRSNADVVSVANSLIGTTPGDSVGASNYFGIGSNADEGCFYGGVVALSNGNYVVASPSWQNGVTNSLYGAVTLANGVTGTIGEVSTQNSLYGTHIYDQIGFAAAAVGNGNFVVTSYSWAGGPIQQGAITWGNGSTGLTGSVSAANSIVGVTQGDEVGVWGATSYADGNYVVGSPNWSNNGMQYAGTGAISLFNGARRTIGTIQASNSVMGTASSGGSQLVYDYDTTRHQLVVGRAADNIVTLLVLDELFSDGFELQLQLQLQL